MVIVLMFLLIGMSWKSMSGKSFLGISCRDLRVDFFSLFFFGRYLLFAISKLIYSWRICGRDDL